MELNLQIFGQPPGSIVSGPAGKGNAVVIAKVVSVNHPQTDVTAADYTNFRKAAAQQLGESVVDTLAAASRQTAGVNIHQATLQRVLGETQQ